MPTTTLIKQRDRFPVKPAYCISVNENTVLGFFATKTDPAVSALFVVGIPHYITILEPRGHRWPSS